MMRRTGPLLVASIAVALAVSACGKTVVVDVSTTTTTVVGETTTLPLGTVAELLPRLRDAAFTLSGAIDDGIGRDTFTSLTNLWVAAKDQMKHTLFVDDVQRQLDLMATAVERKRPGDADKAAMHLKAIIDSYQP